jgi:hypothetical protein
MLLSHQVYLTDRIDNKKRDRMPHMKCVCFLQNNEHSLEALEAELREPKYGEYYLCQSVNLHIGLSGVLGDRPTHRYFQILVIF